VKSTIEQGPVCEQFYFKVYQLTSENKISACDAIRAA
jgi:hypothetical protein